MRILLVEDDLMVASGIKLGLSDAGYAVDWVGSAERTLEVTRSEAFDVAIIDLGLPRLTWGWRCRPFTSPATSGCCVSCCATCWTNAMKFTPEGGTVTLRCARVAGDGAPFLEVEDDAPGVPVPERHRVLERFCRVPGTTSEGNGLGLAIADEIARVHRSQLIVESGLGGRGTRITLMFAA